MSFVKIFIPCYRYAHFLPDAVASVLVQPGVDVRVLILDDCSPDQTPIVAHQLMAQDSRVEYQRNPTNLGHLATYNRGLQWAADGDYTVLLSADDMLTPGALLRAVTVLDAHPEVGLVYGGHILFEDAQQLPVARTPNTPVQVQISTGHQWLRQAFMAGHVLIRSPEVVVRTSLQQQLGGYHPALPHTADIEMWMRFAVYASIAQILDADQAYYRVHQHNMHRQQFATQLADLRQRQAAYAMILAQYADRIPDSQILQTTLKRQLAREAIGTIGSLLDQGQAPDQWLNELFQFAFTTDRFAWMTLEYLGVQGRLLVGQKLTTRFARLRQAMDRQRSHPFDRMA